MPGRWDGGDVFRTLLSVGAVLLFLLPKLLRLSGLLEELVDLLGEEEAGVAKASAKYPGSYLTKAGLDLEQQFFVLPDWEPRNCSADDRQLTAVIHASLNAAQHLPLLALRWGGPIELVMLVASAEEYRTLERLVALLSDCFPTFCRASVHLVFPLALLELEEGRIRDPDTFSQDAWDHEWLADCPALHRLGRLEEMQGGGNFALRNEGIKEDDPILPFSYPANLLRTVGVEQVKSNFHLVLDADVIPSSEAYEGLELHLDKYGKFLDAEKVGLILPTFEVDATECSLTSSSLPRTRAEVLRAVRAGDARPFYSSINSRVQGNTDFPRWYRLDSDRSFQRDLGFPLNQAYWAEWGGAFEPFAVLPSNAPTFDPHFVDYGLNRYAHACEAHVAGFDFAVLDAAFLLHCGFKTKANTHGPKGREDSLRRNQEYFQGKFQTSLIKRYPKSERRC